MEGFQMRSQCMFHVSKYVCLREGMIFTSHKNAGPEEHRLKIDWPTRQNICIGIAKGLSFLHEESSLKIVHRDIKATNVLLDKKLNPKISDFGLARLDDDDNNTHITTRVAGTM